MEEAVDEVDVRGRQQQVVDVGGADAAQVPREDLRVDVADGGAHEGHLAVELHDVLGRQDDPDAVADLRVVPLAHPLDEAAELLGALLVDLQVVVPGHLVAHLDQADAAFFEDDGVVVPLVPALVERPSGLLAGGHQAHGVPVVPLGFFEVGDAHVHVSQTQHTHFRLLRRGARRHRRPKTHQR